MDGGIFDFVWWRYYIYTRPSTRANAGSYGR